MTHDVSVVVVSPGSAVNYAHIIAPVWYDMHNISVISIYYYSTVQMISVEFLIL